MKLLFLRLVPLGHSPYLPYSHFTRNIQVFKPASGEIDDIVVINDGIPYLITGILNHFEKMANENRLSKNTALVFIHALPGLKATLSETAALAFAEDPSNNLPGMGVRLIDYKHGIDQYIDFIANKLFPQLKGEIEIPEDGNHRIMIGSSLSGTATIYIGLKQPDLFGAVIAQSPSPDNRMILSQLSTTQLRSGNIYLSCGAFEHPDFVAANANVEYARELSSKLGIPLYEGLHGHQFVAWNEELGVAVARISSRKKAEALSSTAKTASVLGVNPHELKATTLLDQRELKTMDSYLKTETDLSVDKKNESTDTLGKKSTVAKKLSR